MNKEKIEIEEQINTCVPAPTLTLSATDKIYLALVRKSIKNLTQVYTMVILRDSSGKYPFATHVQVATFKDASHADIYYNAVSGIMRAQSKSCFQPFRLCFVESVKNFYLRMK